MGNQPTTQARPLSGEHAVTGYASGNFSRDFRRDIEDLMKLVSRYRSLVDNSYAAVDVGEMENIRNRASKIILSLGKERNIALVQFDLPNARFNFIFPADGSADEFRRYVFANYADEEFGLSITEEQIPNPLDETETILTWYDIPFDKFLPGNQASNISAATRIIDTALRTARRHV